MSHNIENMGVVLVQFNDTLLIFAKIGLSLDQLRELLVEHLHGLSFDVDLIDVRNFIEVVLDEIRQINLDIICCLLCSLSRFIFLLFGRFRSSNW